MTPLGSIARAVARVVPPSILALRAPTEERKIALTFDDGPQPLTPAYLDCLDELGVYATFFVVGDLCTERPAIVREIQRRGHELGGHGFTHLSFRKLDAAALDQELRDTAALLPPARTRRPLVRPPYGAVDARVVAHLARRGYTTALWSLDSMDHSVKDASELAALTAPDKVRPGEILLFHDGQEWTLAALPRIVHQLRDAGFQLVTMGELLG